MYIADIQVVLYYLYNLTKNRNAYVTEELHKCLDILSMHLYNLLCCHQI